MNMMKVSHALNELKAHTIMGDQYEKKIIQHNYTIHNIKKQKKT